MSEEAGVYEQAIIALARLIHGRNVEIINLRAELARLKQERKEQSWPQSRA